MNPIQIVLTVFLGLAIARVVGAVRATQISWRRGILWIALWVAGIIVVWFPDTATLLARFSGVQRGVDAVLYMTVAMLTYLVFRLYATMEKQDQTLTRLVSELALQNLDTSGAGELATSTERRLSATEGMRSPHP